MKKLFLFIIAVVAFASCGNNDQTAQKLINEELKHTLTDFKSYHPIAFGALDSLFSSYKKDSVYVNLVRKADFYHAQYVAQTGNAILSKTSKDQEAIQAEVQLFQDSAALYKTQADIYAKSFKGTYEGWKMAHTFKSSSTGTVSYYFYFDKHLSKVTGSEKE
jgi:hypothetical protein